MQKLIGLARGLFGSPPLSVDSRFDHMLSFARSVAATNPSALVDVIRMFLRPLQSELLVSASASPLHCSLSEIGPMDFFTKPGCHALRSYSTLPRLPGDGFRVELARDPVLTCPWHRSRLVNNLSHVGSGRVLGPWRQDPNHYVIVFLPWGIAFVAGGNHSIAAGILAGEGSIVPTEVWDASPWLDSFKTDGRVFVDCVSGKEICKVFDPVRAAVFEVGRLMVAHRVVPMTVSAS